MYRTTSEQCKGQAACYVKYDDTSEKVGVALVNTIEYPEGLPLGGSMQCWASHLRGKNVEISSVSSEIPHWLKMD